MRYLYIAILLIISTTIQAQVCIVVDGYTPTVIAGKKVLEICPGVTVSMKAVDDCYDPEPKISSSPTWTLPGNVTLPSGFNNVNTSEPGIYSVYTSNGSTDQIEIKYKPIENLNVSHPRLNNTINILTFCENETINITNAASFSNINWSLNQTDPLGTGNPITLSRNNLPTGGEVYVTATYTTNGCTVRDTFNVIMLQTPRVDLGADTFFCQGAPTTLVLKNKIANYGYPTTQKPGTKWFIPGQTFPIPGLQLIVNTPGIFIHEVASPIVASCVVRDTITILEKTAPAIDPIDDISICANSGVTLKATVAGSANTSTHDFKWRLTGKGVLNTTSQSTITDTPENDQAEYVVRVTDKAAGCYAEERAIVSWYPNQVKATVTFADTSACGTTPVVLGAEGIGGYAPYFYKWFPTTNMTGSTTENPSVIPISQDTITYSVVISDDKGCKDTAYVTVKTPDMRIVIQEGNSLSTCKNDPITLNSLITGGVAPYSIKWTNGTDNLKDSPSQMGLTSSLTIPQPALLTNPKIKVEVLDNRGCPNQDEITVNVVTAPNISYLNPNVPLKVCAGGSVKLPPPTINGGSGNSVFTWTGSNLSDNSATPTYTPAPTDHGTKTFSVKITDTQISCPGNTATITVEVIPTPQVSFAKNDTTICLGTDAVLTPKVSKSGLDFTWTDEDELTLDNASSYTTQEKGIYKVTVTDPVAKCSASASKTVYTIKPGTYAYILADTAVFNDVPLILTSLNDGVNPIYTWTSTGQGQFEDNGFAEAIYKPAVADSGLVSFILDVSTKCGIGTKTDTFTVFFNKKEKPKENIVYIPNAFAPSDINPKNQALMVFSQNMAEDNFQFTIFNRWGEKVFETNDAALASQKGWNGSINNNGSMLKSDVYTYTVKGEFIDGKTFEKSGTATLLR